MTPHSGTSFFILKPWKQRVSILRACEYIDVDWKVRFLWCRVLGCVYEVTQVLKQIKDFD